MEDLKDWFKETWELYPNDLTHKKKGAKPPALKAAEKIYKTGGIQELNRIKENIKALIRYDRKELKQGGRPDRWPHFSSFLNQGYYDREIESYSDLKEKKAVKSCQCGNKVVYISAGLCDHCYESQYKPQWKKDMWERLKKMGLGIREGESKSEWSNRCRQAYKVELRRFND